jgi:beta-lactamase class A
VRVNRTAFLLSSACAVLAPRIAPASSLQGAIERAAAESTGVVGVYARRLGSGEPISYDAEERFPSASTIKLVVLTSLFQAAEREPGLLDHHLTLRGEDFVGGSEVMDAYDPGDRVRISTLARAMIEQSDNTASNALITFLGFKRINRSARDAGMFRTQLRHHFVDYTAVVQIRNLTTAHDMATLLYQIERGAHEGLRTVASTQSCRAMIDILLRQEDRDKIARGLPHGVPLANKSGEIDGVRNDVAIVDPYGDSPYVIAVLTKDLADFSEGTIAIRRIAKAVHRALYEGST